MDIYLIALTWTFWILCFLIVCYIAYTHVLLLTLIIATYVGLHVYRSKNAKRVHIQDQGVLITGCDSGMFYLGFYILNGCNSLAACGNHHLGMVIQGLPECLVHPHSYSDWFLGIGPPELIYWTGGVALEPKQRKGVCGNFVSCFFCHCYLPFDCHFFCSLNFHLIRFRDLNSTK